MDTCLYPTEGVTTRVAPNLNSGLWVIATCQCRFNRYSIRWGAPIVPPTIVGCGGAVHLLLNSAVNLKLLQKIVHLKKSAALKTSL